ncbi:MAG: L-seryl-tRNA(Sec) selenium transferase [Verrucomicrobiota bacterium]
MDRAPDHSFARLRELPSVDAALRQLEHRGLLPDLPQSLLTDIVRDRLAARRAEIMSSQNLEVELRDPIEMLGEALEAFANARLQPVINGTGVLLHTNLGRVPWNAAAVNRAVSVASGYSNLEFDLETGERGKRGDFAEFCLAKACGAGATTLVNNCASALILILRELANEPRAEVIISRGELIEIGGGFRIPEILEISGARLREVGTTNRTRLSDYEKAIGPETGMILKVHRSNFYQEGFVEEPSLGELVALGQANQVPVVFDLGSGAMSHLEEQAPVSHEPTMLEAMHEKVDLVCASADKLFGGPQAGIIAGRKELVQRMKKNPLFRALRCDKVFIAALQETVLLHLENHTETPLPFNRMLSADVDALKNRALKITEDLNGANLAVGQSVSRCGGGTMPRDTFPSATIDFKPVHLSLTAAARVLRGASFPVVARVEKDVLKIDLRTVFPAQDGPLREALQVLIEADRESSEANVRDEG